MTHPSTHTKALPLPLHEVRARVRDTAAAWVAHCGAAEDDSPEQEWAFGVLFAADGGQAALGMDLAQYRTAVRDWCVVLRITGAYVHCRATMEAARPPVATPSPPVRCPLPAPRRRR